MLQRLWLWIFWRISGEPDVLDFPWIFTFDFKFDFDLECPLNIRPVFVLDHHHYTFNHELKI